ncbi:MAG: hypothetical protein RBS19_03030 [Bacteroidales bacterium]|nr:hypothetical protein [Bacteroidales bacterium]MDY0215910.1 hypothetical protein [Bacteroidales bacterium]
MLKDLDNQQTEKKPLRIVALVDNTPFGMTAAEHGLKFAEIFKSELVLVACHAQVNAEKVAQSLRLKNENIPIIIQKVEKLNHKNFHATLEELNAILMVLSVSKNRGLSYFSAKSALKIISKLRIPSVVCGTKPPEENAYKDVMLPLNIHRQAKEKSLWAGYFSRFYNATVHVLYTVYKDEYLKNRLYENAKFTEKLYENLEVNYKNHVIEKVKQEIDEFAVDYAKQIGASLILVMTTRYYSIFDYIFGPIELKIMTNEHEIPIMLINQRDDLYVLCT